jgi:4a-hydroxytetrahydrobiopterin dehydratase
MPETLADRKCLPCRGGVPPLTPEQTTPLLASLNDGWRIANHHHLTRDLKFPDFAQALAFVNRVGAEAEQQGHHPDVHLAWGKVRLDIWTHKIDGLTESDFIFAAKCDRLL